MNIRCITAIFLILVGIVMALLSGVSYLQPQKAMAELRNNEGQMVGQADFVQQADGVRMTVGVKNLSPGMHGIHIHAMAMCSPPNFTTAGGHFNPEGKKHGLKSVGGPHAGDLPNLEVGADGTGKLGYVNSRVTLSSDASNSLFKVNGTSLVIHAKADDDATDPAGNSGARIACGPIVAVDSSIGPLPEWLFEVIAAISLVSGFVLWTYDRRHLTAQNT